MHTVEGTWHTRQRCTKNTPLSGAYSALMLSVLNCQVFLRDSVQLTLNYMYWIVWSYLMLLIHSFMFRISICKLRFHSLTAKLIFHFFPHPCNPTSTSFPPPHSCQMCCSILQLSFTHHFRSTTTTSQPYYNVLQ